MILILFIKLYPRFVMHQCLTKKIDTPHKIILKSSLLQNISYIIDHYLGHNFFEKMIFVL